MDPSSASSYSYLAIRMRKSLAFLRYLAVKRHRQQGRVAGAEGDGGATTGIDAGAHQKLNSANTIFVAGLPYGLHRAETLRQLFATFGEVADVAVHQKQTSALVVFRTGASADALLAAAANRNILEFFPPEPKSPYGLKGWVEEHKAKYPGKEALKQQIEDFWQGHLEEQERKQREREAAMTDDGWTLVTRHKGRKKNRDDGGTAVAGASAAAAAERAKSKASASLDDFYRFQSREKRRDELLELRAKFQQDKKRIAELRAQRRFRPY